MQVVKIGIPLGLIVLVCGTYLLPAGDLEPPLGPVAPTMKALDVVEARTPVIPANFPGDVDDFVIISEPGSYYLTGNVVGEPMKNGIRLAVSDIHLDLNGFSVVGVPGSWNGIVLSNGDGRIHGGTVQGWDGFGVSASNSVVSDLILRNNGISGFQMAGCVVTNCTARSNGDGFTGFSSNLTRCVGQLNDDDGFDLQNSMLQDCLALANLDNGFEATSTTFTNCMARQNDQIGFNASQSRIDRCTARGNSVGIEGQNYLDVVDTTIEGNNVEGVSISGYQCRILNCRSTGNTGGGILITISATENHVEGNDLGDNIVGIQVNGTGNFIRRNNARDNLIDYVFAGGNNYGPVVFLSGGGVITGVPNGDHPWANFSF